MRFAALASLVFAVLLASAQARLALTWTPATLPDAVAGTPYHVAVKVTTGLDPLASQQGPPDCRNDGSVVREAPIFDDCGKMPPGLRVERPPGNGDTAFIVGTPARSGGPYNFKLLDTWLDANGKLAYSQRGFTMRVKPGGADLSVEVQGPKLVKASEPFAYTFVVRDAGAEAREVKLEINVPFFSDYITGVVAPLGHCEQPRLHTRVECTFDAIAPGKAVDVRVKVKANEANATSSGRDILISAKATSSTTDPQPDNNHVTFEARWEVEADVYVLMSAPRSVSSGESLDWVIRVANKGPDWTYVRLEDNVPAQVDFRLFGGCGHSGNHVSCTLELSKGERRSITIRGTVPIGARGVLKNVAKVTTEDRDPLLRDNTAETVTQID